MSLPHAADKRSPEGRAAERKRCTLKPQHRPLERVVAQRLPSEPLAAKRVEEVTKRASRAAFRPSSRAACLLAAVERQAFRGRFARAVRTEVAKALLRVTSDSSPGSPQCRPRRGRRFWPASSGCAYSNVAISEPPAASRAIVGLDCSRKRNGNLASKAALGLRLAKLDPVA